MKLYPYHSRAHRRAGITLIECLAYISVFLILFGIATSAFYFCWDHTRAVVGATSDVEAALQAGERWRTDIRHATGPIAVQTASDGETVRIPEAGKDVVYIFQEGEIRRQAGNSEASQLLLPKVKSSGVKPDTRGEVTAWRWELQIASRRKETSMPLLFTFEAVQPHS